MMNINDLIVATARKYIGITEKKANSGFNDAKFEERMKKNGWLSGQSWCAYFSELVYKEAYAAYPEILKEIDKLCSGSATETYKKFDLNPNWEVSQIPVPGALAVWRHGIGWKGHIGVVTEADIKKKTFNSCDGNTNDEGGREGIEVAEMLKKLDFTIRENKLNLIGFIIPRIPA